MRFISEQTIRATKEKFDALPFEEFVVLQQELLARQGALAGFASVVGKRELSGDGWKVAVLLALYLWQIFEQEASEPLVKITVEEILSAYDKREEWFDSFAGMSEQEFDRWMGLSLEIPQERVAAHAAQVLVDNSLAYQDQLKLSNEDIGQLMGMALAMIDVLDAKLQETVGNEAKNAGQANVVA
jgi:hypothetical protein